MNMKTKLKGTEVNLCGDLPEVGIHLPDFTLVSGELAEVNLNDYANEALVLNIFPSIDTGTCAASVRHFNTEAAGLANHKVLCISADLPFAQQRFCGAEGIDNAITLSAYRSDFGNDYGIKMIDGHLQGLLARCVVVTDRNHKVIYTQLVDEITVEPDYAQVFAAINAS